MKSDITLVALNIQFAYNLCSINCIKLMKSYLDNRSQAVSLGGKMSEQGTVKCGVPRGSILGPSLFFIFINDMPVFIREHVFSTDFYADDTILYYVQKDVPTIKKLIYYERFIV